MASVARHPLPEKQAFAIHEDVVTDEVEMADDPEQQTEEVRAPSEDAQQASEEASEVEESSEDESAAPSNVVRDMEKLGREVPGIKGKYRLIKRIGEGMLDRVVTRAARLLSIPTEQKQTKGH